MSSPGIAAIAMFFEPFLWNFPRATDISFRIFDAFKTYTWHIHVLASAKMKFSMTKLLADQPSAEAELPALEKIVKQFFQC